MKTICFDPVTGASGDMILAALFDLGADPEFVENKLRTTGLHEFELSFERKANREKILCGFCQVNVHHSHHAEQETCHNKEKHHRHDRHHHHRGLKDILELIDLGDFSNRAKDRAAAVFRRLAEAEGAVHGVSPQEVHFHEVGAVDSIVDIVGSCLALEQLQVETIYVSAFKIGTGTVECEHGTMPLPAPATARLLEVSRVQRLDINSELTTPTGAALLTTLSDGDWNNLDGKFIKSGTGHGRRCFDSRPNILRAYLMELPQASETVEVIECDIDDQTPEMLAILTDQLRQKGAVDVMTSPIMMKKNRHGIRLTVLSPLSQTEQLSQEILGQSSTIGVRIHTVRRILLPRHSISIDTPWGQVQAKKIERPSGTEIVPEAGSCAALAETAKVPVRQIVDSARSWLDQE